MNKPLPRSVSLTSLFFAASLLAAVMQVPAADDSPTRPAPPVAKQVPKVTEINGYKLVDNYFWLRDKKTRK